MTFTHSTSLSGVHCWKAKIIYFELYPHPDLFKRCIFDAFLFNPACAKVPVRTTKSHAQCISPSTSTNTGDETINIFIVSASEVSLRQQESHNETVNMFIASSSEFSSDWYCLIYRFSIRCFYTSTRAPQ